nr:hypothetical protein [Tanacetum cinerariifolium]
LCLEVFHALMEIHITSDLLEFAKTLKNSKVFFSTPTGGIYGKVRVNTFRNAIGAHYLPHSSEYVAPPSIDIVRLWFEIGMGKLFLPKGLSKNVFFLLGGGTKPEAKPEHKKHLTSSKQPSVYSKEVKKGGSSKASTISKTGHSTKRKVSSSAIDSNPSQPPISTPVDTRIQKEDQQATSGPTSLGVTSEARVNPHLSIGNDASTASIAKADIGNFAPSTNRHVLANQTKSVSEGLETVLTQPIIGKGASSVAKQIKEELSNTIKLEDLAKLVLHVSCSFKVLNSPKDDPVIVVDDSDEDEDDEAFSSEEAEKESINSDSNNETHVTGFMVEPSKTKKLKNFDFITKDGRYIHLTKEEINHKNKLKEDAKAKAAKQEGEVMKAELLIRLFQKW